MPLAVPLQAILVGIAINFLWGGNPIAVKFSLLVFPPLWTAFLRFLIAAVCILAWASWRNVRVWPNRAEWPVLVGLALLFAVQIGSMNAGFDRTTGAMGSVLIATNPLFSAVFAHLLLAGDRLSPLRAAGLLLALAGAGLALLQDSDLASLDFGASGNWIVLASAALLGLRLVWSARALRDMDEVRVALWQMLIALPVFGVGGLAFETIRWQQLAWAPILGLLYQGVVIAGLGFMVSFYLMKRYTPSVIMSFNFVSPIAGVVLAAWLLGDPVSALLLLALLLVAAGLFMTAQVPRPDHST